MKLWTDEQLEQLKEDIVKSPFFTELEFKRPGATVSFNEQFDYFVDKIGKEDENFFAIMCMTVNLCRMYEFNNGDVTDFARGLDDLFVKRLKELGIKMLWEKGKG